MKVITGIHFGNHDMKIQESIIRVQNRHQDMNYNWNISVIITINTGVHNRNITGAMTGTYYYYYLSDPYI